MPLIRDVLKQSKSRFEAAGVYSPEADAELIVSYILGLPRAALKDMQDNQVTGDLQQKIEDAVRQREARLPLARIFGKTSFRGLTIKVGEGVFEPCVEVETIIEYAHMLLEKRQGQKNQGPLRILDCGTGTGCILLALLNEIPQATGVGVDISEAAVALARENAAACNLDARVEFRVNDWTSRINEKFDLIVANPPFVPTSVIPVLAPEVRVHDPYASLNGGKDGLHFYRRLAHDFDHLTNEGAHGIFQLSLTYCDMVHGVFLKNGYKNAAVKRSYFGIPMCVIIEKEDYRPSFLRKLLNMMDKRLPL